MLSTEIKEKTGLVIPVTRGSGGVNSILITSNGALDSLGKEGYNLSVKPDKIILKAKNENGTFYGMQTILQLLPVTKKELQSNTILIPAVEIIDKPRFE